MTNIKKRVFYTWIFILFLIPLFFGFVSTVYAVDVTLQWDKNSEPNLDGYRVFSREEGQSYDYKNPYWESMDTVCTIYDLDETKTNYFVVRAFNTEGFESSNSNEVCLEANKTPELVFDIKVNGSDKLVSIDIGENLSITVECSLGNYKDVLADWWILVDSPSGWYGYDYATETWLTGFNVSYQGPLDEVSLPLAVLNTSDLTTGDYTFYFIVDNNMDGNLDEPLYYDSIDVRITSP